MGRTLLEDQITETLVDSTGRLWPEWLALGKLAVYLGVSRKTIYNWYNNGELPRPAIIHGKKHGKNTTRKGPRKYWRRTEIDEWMQRKQQVRRTRRY